MKTKYITIIAFAVTIIAQAFIPLKMIFDSEITGKYGTVYKFKTSPVDPNDPFRGKYIVLDFEADKITDTLNTWHSGEQIYVTLARDADGFAWVKGVHREIPETETYIATYVDYFDGTDLIIDLPFNRFYMEESKAYEAETGYRKYSDQKKAKPAYALVAIKNGNAVLKDVIIDDIPIKDYVIRERKK